VRYIQWVCSKIKVTVGMWLGAVEGSDPSGVRWRWRGAVGEAGWAGVQGQGTPGDGTVAHSAQGRPLRLSPLSNTFLMCGSEIFKL